jgi:ABC-type sugar transport system ATPase subunit
MNFADGIVTAAEGGPLYEGQGLKLSLVGSRFARLQELPNQNVALGVRAESLRFVPSTTSGDSRMYHSTATVKVVEILGAAMDVTVQLTPSLSWVCRAATREIRVGEVVHVAFPLDELHVFASVADDCGKNLILASEDS